MKKTLPLLLLAALAASVALADDKPKADDQPKTVESRRRCGSRFSAPRSPKPLTSSVGNIIRSARHRHLDPESAVTVPWKREFGAGVESREFAQRSSGARAPGRVRSTASLLARIRANGAGN